MNRPVARVVGAGRSEEGDKLVRKLNEGGILTCGQYLSSSALALRKIGLDALDIAEVQRCIEENVAPKPVTAKYMLGANFSSVVLSSHRGSSVSAIFDSGRVTELSGPAFVGKSLLCVDITVRCIINSIHRQNCDRVEGAEKPREKPPTVAFYVDVKKKMNSKSGLKEKVDKIVSECAAQKDPADLSPDIGVDAVVPCFQIVDVESPKSLIAWLQSEELQMTVSMSDVAIIVIDSLPTLLTQCPPEDGDYESFIINLTTLLRSLAESCNCPVIITTMIPAGSFIREVQEETGVLIRDIYRSAFPLSPTLQHCVQSRQVLIFDSYPNPTVPPLNRHGRRCLLSEMRVGHSQRVAHFDLDEIGELLRLQ